MTKITWMRAALLAGASLTAATPAAAQQDQSARIAEMQAQIDELRAQVQALVAAKAAAPAPVPAGSAESAPPAMAGAAAPAASPALAAASPARKKPWFEKLQLRGYTQMRVNEVISGDKDAPAGIARLRSPHDTSVGEPGNFSFRRVRLVVQGDVSERLSIYLQSDFAASVNAQSNGERRDNFVQLRDAYADLHFGDDKAFKLRFGQQKVPYGWENLQSSSNRLTLDRADAANSAVPSERDLGITAYYTPRQVDAIWDELADDGQKLFGNYGAFGVGVYNGQGVNRAEKNDSVMAVAMATWPFRLDGLGLEGQVLELGAEGMLNRIQPEVRTGGVSATAFKEKRVNLHAVLYPNPIGFQAEWNWGRGPEWDRETQSILSKNLSGGYFQTMFRVKKSPIGAFMPYARYQRYRGGWKGSTNVPRLETDEIELGIEFQPLKELELTVAYANMKRAEPDDRRLGRAQGDMIRTQLQWNY